MHHTYSKVKTVLKYSFKELNICYVKRIYCFAIITIINQKMQTTSSVSEIKKKCIILGYLE